MESTLTADTAPSVLLIDDHEDSREVYCQFLELSGFRVDGVSTGEEGVRFAKEKSPSIIVMDLTLPGMDGVEATRILREDPKTSTIPVIALTGHNIGKSPDFDVVLTKPALPDRLLDEVQRLLTENASGARA